MPVPSDLKRQLQSIEEVLARIDAAADPSLRATVQKLMQLVMGLHGAGLERMLELIGAGEDGETIIAKLGREELVSSLLVLHGLHPMSLEARVTQALEKARLRLKVHEGDVELLGFQNGVVQLRLSANGHGCGSTSEALKEIVEDSIYQGAPDVTALAFEEAPSRQSFVPIEMLQSVAVPAGKGGL